ncbi:hypothetical protein [Nocardia sp. NPDC024068]
MPALTAMFDHAPRTRPTDPPGSGRLLIGFWVVSIAVVSLLLALL